MIVSQNHIHLYDALSVVALLPCTLSQQKALKELHTVASIYLLYTDVTVLKGKDFTYLWIQHFTQVHLCCVVSYSHV